MTRTDLRGSQDTRGCARKERVPRVSSAASATASGAPSWAALFDVTWKHKKRLGIKTIAAPDTPADVIEAAKARRRQCQQSFDRMTAEIFDADLLEPAGLHDTGDADRIVTVAFIDCILSTALAWRASIQITGMPSRLSSLHSHVAVGPLSSPTRTASGALDLTNAAITSGSEPTGVAAMFPYRWTARPAQLSRGRGTVI